MIGTVQTPVHDCEECGGVCDDGVGVRRGRILCIPCWAHTCERCGVMDSETINAADLCFDCSPSEVH